MRFTANMIKAFKQAGCVWKHYAIKVLFCFVLFFIAKKVNKAQQQRSGGK